MRELHKTYQDDGLVIIGVHTPEFSYEKELANVEDAVAHLDIAYPVAIDNDWTTWRAFSNRYWPAQYIIDKAGNIRQVHIGEVHVGDKRFENTKLMIEALLVEEI